MNIYTAVFLFVWCSKTTSSVGAVNIRGGAAAAADEQHQFVARLLAKPWCGDNKCSGGENCDTCAADCGCADGETCTAGSCVSGGPSPTTPSPSPTPPPGPSSTCGRCVVDNLTPCSAPTDCPTTSVQGTCSAPTSQPTNGNSCDNDGQCLPNSGKPANRGTCEGGGTTNTQCDTSLTCQPTTAPVSTPVTSSPTKAPTTAPSSEPTKSPTAAPVTPSPTNAPTGSPNTPSPTPNPTTTTSSPTKQYFCGCPSCTLDIWNAQACSDAYGGCYTCGDRITYVAGLPGETLDSACTTVSDQFASGPCGPACNPAICNDNVLDEPDAAKLVWSDEFDADGAPDPDKWDYDIGDGCDKGICGWGNNELQYYTDSNAVVSNGVLRITAKKESVGGKQYTSSRMVSRGKQTFQYGRIRIRARMAGCTATGTWPALWMLPETWVYGGWPDSGEIDIVEMVGYETDKFHASVHTKSYNHGIGTQKTGSISKSEADWHIFEIEWQVDKIRFAIDSNVYFVFAPEDVNNSEQWPFNQDFHILMNIAVGGNWGGLQGVDSAAFEGVGQYMEVDWVRAYSV